MRRMAVRRVRVRVRSFGFMGSIMKESGVRVWSGSSG
jgi:hypothetical protein